MEWNAPEACPAEQFTTRVDSLLGKPFSEVPNSVLQVHVSQPSPQRWTLSLTLANAQGENKGRREISGRDCEDVVRAGALAAVLAIQASEPAAGDALDASNSPVDVTSAESAAVPNSPTPAPSPAPERPAPAASGVVSTGEQSAPVVIRAHLMASGDASVLGEPTWGLGLGLSAGYRWLDVGLVGQVFQPVELRGDAGRGGVFSLQAGGVWLCARGQGGRLSPLGCANVEVGALSGEGRGSAVTVSHPRSALWLAVRPELGLAFAFTEQLEAQLRAGLSIALERPAFVLDNEAVMLRPDLFAARVGLSLAWRF